MQISVSKLIQSDNTQEVLLILSSPAAMTNSKPGLDYRLVLPGKTAK